MPNWKFWDRPTEETPSTSANPAPGPRFNVRPRTDLPNQHPGLDPAKAEQIAKLQRRRNMILFDVEQAELALQPDNPWLERVALLDAAVETVRADRASFAAEVATPGIELPALPVTAITVSLDPPPSVAFKIGDEPFIYEEDIDWAERGFQIARSDLQLRSGDVSRVIAAAGVAPDQELTEHLTASIFAFATDLRERSVAGIPLPDHVTLADLARPDTDAGGWLDWKGHSQRRAVRERRSAELHAEEMRLLDERERELTELGKWEDRLPIASRRLADIDAEIASLGG